MHANIDSETCIKTLLMSLLMLSCSIEVMPTNEDVSHSQTRQLSCCYSCIQIQLQSLNSNVDRLSANDHAPQCFWDAARRKGLPTPGGPSSRIDPACLLAALPGAANSANLSISMVATPAHQTGLTWHHSYIHG